MGIIATSINQAMTQQDVNRQRGKIDELIRKLKTPDFDYTKLDPEDYAAIKQYIPEVAPYVEEKNPELVKLTEDALAGRESQMDALQKFRNLGRTGEDTQSRLLNDAALRDAAIQEQGQRATIQDNMARRGLGGGAMDFASQMLAQQGAAQRGALTSQQNAANSYQNRLDALRTGASLGGDIRQSDIDLSAQNAGIQNAYNQRYAANQNAYNQYAAGTRNDAQLRNLDEQQKINALNTTQKNQSMQDYQDRYNQRIQQDYQNQVGKTGLKIGAREAKIGDAEKQGQQREDAVKGTRESIMGIMKAMYGGGGG